MAIVRYQARDNQTGLFGPQHDFSMLAAAFGLILFIALAMILAGDTGLASDDILLLWVALGLIGIVGALAAFPSLQDRRYRQLVERGLGVPRKSRWAWFKGGRRVWIGGLLVLAILAACLKYLNTATAPSAPSPRRVAETSTAIATPPHAAPNGSSQVAPQPPAPTVQDVVAQRKEIDAAVRGWAKAWAAREIDSYLAAYSPAFTPVDGVSRKEWESVRRTRIGKAKDLTIDVHDIVVTPIDKTRAEAAFIQRYSARGMTERSRKTLMLERTEEQWKILHEKSSPIAVGRD